MNSMAEILIVRPSFPTGLATQKLRVFIIYALWLELFLGLPLFLAQITLSSASIMRESICGGTPFNDLMGTLCRWLTNHRNFGIIIAFTLFFMFTYLYFTETIPVKKSKGEILQFRRGYHAASKHNDVESFPSSKPWRLGEEISAQLPQNVSAAIQRQTAVFQWKNICFDIEIKKETRRILDHVDGWVKPGTLTALMVCYSMLSNDIADLKSLGTFWSWENNLT